jgi:hypothetical protein
VVPAFAASTGLAHNSHCTSGGFSLYPAAIKQSNFLQQHYASYPFYYHINCFVKMSVHQYIKRTNMV